jgi:hypothetical protein
MVARFDLGQVLGTPNLLGGTGGVVKTPSVPRTARCRRLGRGQRGDAKLNELALVDSTRLLSAYKRANSLKGWLPTETDRSLMTALLPSEF